MEGGRKTGTHHRKKSALPSLQVMVPVRSRLSGCAVAAHAQTMKMERLACTALLLGVHVRAFSEDAVHEAASGRSVVVSIAHARQEQGIRSAF